MFPINFVKHSHRNAHKYIITYSLQFNYTRLCLTYDVAGRDKILEYFLSLMDFQRIQTSMPHYLLGRKIAPGMVYEYVNASSTKLFSKTMGPVSI